MNETTTTWEAHEIDGKIVAKCSTCGANAHPANLEEPDDCASCIVIAKRAEVLAEAKRESLARQAEFNAQFPAGPIQIAR